MAERSMALRRGFDEMDKHIAKDAVVQYNTARLATPIMFAQVMQVNRQTVDGQPGCGTAFGGDVPECARIEAGVRRLFSTTNSPDPSDDEESLSVPAGKSISAEEARSTCKSLGVDYLVATRWDGVWTDRQGWAWTLPKVVDTNEVRVIDCNAAMR
jgi:hypothetical protein